MILGSQSKAASRHGGVVAFIRSPGWRVLAEVPGCEILMARPHSRGCRTLCFAR